MKAQELRIGNIVNRRYHNPNPTGHSILTEPCVVKLIRESIINVTCGISDKRIVKQPIDNISGIPLTEEWLLKCGFNTVTESSAGKRYSIVENHIFNNDLTVVYWKTTSNAGKIMRGDLQIKNVHQLQNLVFALTDAELTIK